MPILDNLSKGLKKGLEEAEKGLKSVGEKAEKGFKDVSEKASDTVKTFEIQQEIGKLEDEIKEIKLALGEKAVELVAKGETLNPALDELVTKITGIQTKIEGKKALIEQIKND